MNAENDSARLLNDFADHRSEAAFGELVRRHLDLVYSTAVRSCAGDTALAEDVAQTVFAAWKQEMLDLLAWSAFRLPDTREVRFALATGRWVSRAEAAETLGISVDTVDRRIVDGSLRVRRIGRAVRVQLEPATSDEQIAQLVAGARR